MKSFLSLNSLYSKSFQLIFQNASSLIKDDYFESFQKIVEENKSKDFNHIKILWRNVIEFAKTYVFAFEAINASVGQINYCYMENVFKYEGDTKSFSLLQISFDSLLRIPYLNVREIFDTLNVGHKPIGIGATTSQFDLDRLGLTDWKELQVDYYPDKPINLICNSLAGKGGRFGIRKSRDRYYKEIALVENCLINYKLRVLSNFGNSTLVQKITKEANNTDKIKTITGLNKVQIKQLIENEKEGFILNYYARSIISRGVDLNDFNLFILWNLPLTPFPPLYDEYYISLNNIMVYSKKFIQFKNEVKEFPYKKAIYQLLQELSRTITSDNSSIKIPIMDSKFLEHLNNITEIKWVKKFSDKIRKFEFNFDNFNPNKLASIINLERAKQAIGENINYEWFEILVNLFFDKFDALELRELNAEELYNDILSCDIELYEMREDLRISYGKFRFTYNMKERNELNKIENALQTKGNVIEVLKFFKLQFENTNAFPNVNWFRFGLLIKILSNPDDLDLKVKLFLIDKEEYTCPAKAFQTFLKTIGFTNNDNRSKYLGYLFSNNIIISIGPPNNLQYKLCVNPTIPKTTVYVPIVSREQLILG